jgi:hypothetical protein
MFQQLLFQWRAATVYIRNASTPLPKFIKITIYFQVFRERVDAESSI